ncbi:hypothetical protein Kpol_1001p2 [Vanderwaltozyma polyspora DSM 70294]|uniref:ENTH domain-containing protein n=1 Tax=Vanderwaltozyma polyspora (strain ATCC 22028 / DSM 70294 / BCRC 21397 / CBS 2163 / NBRC 10782 / NRRL Y-8283 / UCD 57-17) TaxID=436907 RepID=A7TNN9_VANPO|nr:uncharacterized protein Kpol_1001p2 [Vanderwaltozyma polyspora DSM 70294]EDO16090.1 hypothetical protein Kpol_1001p2 [Vanderwaltozyma polyspora DSM 70294]
MSLEDTLSNLSIYDAKKYFRKAQNVMFNYTEMEGKVREATNNEPWGASSTLMEQISQGTYNIREREEILSMIFRRFTEKTASEWRQIYKALQLLEYLIKHGSERFIDDVRSSLSLIKMLESFHYIDSQGRDQGINVRNKAQSLTALLKDDEQIRAERKKARETSKKFKGVAGGSASESLAGKNTRAGFNTSNRHNISVSADFDSDDDNNDDVAPRLTSSEITHANSDDLFSYHGPAVKKNSEQVHHQLQEEEDDDDFAEFQSSVPISQETQSTSAITTATNNDSLFDFNSPPVPSTTTASTIGTPQTSNPVYAMPNVEPAISSQNNKKSDPFGSLFMTAKADKTPIVPTPAKSTVNTTPANFANDSSNSVPLNNDNNDDDDDDLFGEMTAASTTAPQPTASAPTTSVSQNDEINLLDF